MFEKTLVIIKPDGVMRNLIGKIIDSYEVENLKIIDMKMLKISRQLAEQHYKEHFGKEFYNGLIDYITSSPSVVIELEGENAIKNVRALNVKLREKYGVDARQNTVHGSDSKESAEYEIKLYFDK